MKSVGVPYGIKDEERPNVASTQWSVVIDHSDLKYYFSSVLSPSLFWVDLNKFDLSKGQPVKKLELNEGTPTFAGEVSSKFVPAEPFKFLQ